MKKSKYNFFYEYGDEYIAYNARTNAMALVESDDVKLFKENFEKLSEEKKKEFKHGGFLIPDYVDELKTIKNNMFSARYSRTHLGLVIAPTLGCNFNCEYCFEDTQDDMTKMSKEIQEKLVEFVESNSKNIDRIDVTWYGGEPTLCMDIIENLSKRFIEICDEKNINYGAAIITNGYLISQKTCDIFKKYKINQVQITVDGLEEEHNRRRPLKGGGKTFEEIVKGLHILNKNKININLRVNIDRNNYQSFKEVVAFIEKENLLEYVKPYPGIVSSINDKYSEDKCFDLDDYSDFNISKNKDLEKVGIDQIYGQYPNLVSNFCGADSINSYIINPYGYFLSCWDEVGKNENAYATLNSDDVEKIKADRLKYILYDPTEDEYCKECKVLPLCMGGCPYQRQTNKHRCIDEKQNLEDKLRVYVNKIF